MLNNKSRLLSGGYKSRNGQRARLVDVSVNGLGASPMALYQTRGRQDVIKTLILDKFLTRYTPDSPVWENETLFASDAYVFLIKPMNAGDIKQFQNWLDAFYEDSSLSDMEPVRVTGILYGEEKTMLDVHVGNKHYTPVIESLSEDDHKVFQRVFMDASLTVVARMVIDGRSHYVVRSPGR